MMTIGTLVAGRYEIRDRLGQGAQGHVLEAFDRQLGRLVALKILPICGESADERDERRRRFLTEARAAARLQHPGIVAVHDAGEAENQAWIAMELVIGQTLRDALRGPVRLPLREALRIGRELLDALDAAHARGVIHRDVKPCNIMLAMDAGDGHGRVRLTDFGIASLVVGQKPADIEFVGTPSVMAPEQIRGEACDERTDLWSAGVVLYELLTGIPPFAGGVPAIYSAVLARDPLPPTLLNPDLPLGFDALMETALAKSIDRRFQSTQEMAAAIDAAAGDLLSGRMAEAASSPHAAMPSPRAPARGQGATALAFLAGAAVASAGFVWRDSGWQSWPGQPVIAAAFQPALGAAPAAEGPRPVAKTDGVAADSPPEARTAAAIPVEPMPADAGLASADTAAGPSPLPEHAPAIPAARMETAVMPVEPSVPPLVTVAEALEPVATMAEALPPSRLEPEATPERPTPDEAIARPTVPPSVAAAHPGRDAAPETAPSIETVETPHVAATPHADARPEPAGASPVVEPGAPMAVAERAAEPPVMAITPAAATCIGRAPQFATGNHPGYGRVVLRWSQPVRYRALLRPGGIRLEFSEPFCIAVGPGAALPRNVRAVAGAPGVIEIDAVPGSSIRHFTLDRRTVIDVADSQGR